MLAVPLDQSNVEPDEEEKIVGTKKEVLINATEKKETSSFGTRSFLPVPLEDIQERITEIPTGFTDPQRCCYLF